jgi:hypothetical protein
MMAPVSIGHAKTLPGPHVGQGQKADWNKTMDEPAESFRCRQLPRLVRISTKHGKRDDYRTEQEPES